MSLVIENVVQNSMWRLMQVVHIWVEIYMLRSFRKLENFLSVIDSFTFELPLLLAERISQRGNTYTMKFEQITNWSRDHHRPWMALQPTRTH